MTRGQFIAYVNETQESLRRFLVALCCGDTQLAEDIAQDSYMKAYLACDSFRSKEMTPAWIRRIAYNSFISHRRVEKATVDYTDAETVYASDYADASFRYQELYAALASLSEKERTAVVMFYLENYSVKEIAEILETSHDAVRQLLSRGRNHLRSSIRQK